MARAPIVAHLAAASSDGQYAGWHRFWLCWFLISIGTFLTAEIYALATDWRRTLSASVWFMEKFVPHQKVSEWSFAHFMFAAVFLLMAVWLFFHFSMGWWRD